MNEKGKNIIKAGKGFIKKKRRVGRGPGSGRGKTAGRGHKGQRSRSGAKIRSGFEGGQMPLQRRVPKRGFTNIFKKEFYIINLAQIEKKLKSGEILNIKKLVEYGFIKVGNSAKRKKKMIKILSKGDISKPITVYTHKISKSAAKKIIDAGGKVFILEPKVKLVKKILELSDNDILKKELEKVD